MSYTFLLGNLFNRALCEIFSQAKNPYDTTLDLIRASPDYYQPKGNTMTVAFMRQLGRWSSDTLTVQKKQRLLTLDVRKRAYEICATKHTHLLPKLVRYI